MTIDSIEIVGATGFTSRGHL